jgi:hypothetical protein
MARQAGFYQAGHTSYQVITATIQDFAKLVAEREREACALKAEDFLTESELDWDGDFWNQAVERVAMAIRARGQA